MSLRTDGTGAALAGSQLQTQLWVNQRTAGLDAALRDAIPDLPRATFNWRSPVKSKGYREYRDGAFLSAVGLAEHAAALQTFWPARGPVWDALAVVQVDGQTGVLLAEGKSYPGELYRGGSKAGPESRERIEVALRQTQAWLGIDVSMKDWCVGPLYQTANRLAHLYWLRELVSVPAWFVHLLYLDDPHAAYATTAGEVGHRTGEGGQDARVA